MSDVVYVSKSSIERRRGPLRVAHLPGESQPVIYSVHGAIIPKLSYVYRSRRSSLTLPL